jgi:hypothetical protein
LDDELNVGGGKGCRVTSMVGRVLTLLRKVMSIEGDQIESKKIQSISDLNMSRPLMDKDPSKNLGKDNVAIDKMINFDPSSQNPKPKATNFISGQMQGLGGSIFNIGEKIVENSVEVSSDDLNREIRKTLLANPISDLKPMAIERKKSVKPKPMVTQSQERKPKPTQNPNHSVRISPLKKF